MGLIGKVISAAKKAYSTAKKNSSTGGYTTSSASGSSSSSASKSTGGSSSGYFDANKDYAAALKNVNDAAERARLVNERQNKINYMNGQGTNKGYSNNIYGSRFTGTNGTNRYGAQGTYNGDSSMSLPDAELLQGYQQAYNTAKLNGDRVAMDSAHKMAEKLRTNYREHPLANSTGYNLGENQTGFIRDMAVRVDDMGNRYVDEYNQGTVTTRAYDPTGRLIYTRGDMGGSDIRAHNARVNKDMAETNRRLAVQKKPNDTFYARIADPEDLKLGNEELKAKYGANGNLTELGNGFEYGDYRFGDYGNRDTEGVVQASGGSRDDSYTGIADSLAEARNAQLEAMLAQIDMEKQQGGQSFDEIARQAYIAKRQSETALPEQLAAMGISGGASETTQLGLASSYQNNLNSNEQARQNMIQQFVNQAFQAKMAADSDIGGYYADAEQAAMAARQQQMAQQASQNQWQTQFDYQQQQDMLDRQWQEQQYKSGLTQYELEMALKMGDYNKLGAAGYNTSYLQQMQKYELMQAARQAVGRSSKSSSTKTVQGKTIIGNDSGSGWVSVPGFGKLSNADLLKYVNSGAISEVPISDGKGNTQIYYTANR